MTTITIIPGALEYIKTVTIIPGEYNNGSLYIGLYDTETQELYSDLSTYIMPVLPNEFYVETGTERERFAREQKTLFHDTGMTVKQGFNTYTLFRYTEGGKQ